MAQCASLIAPYAFWRIGSPPSRGRHRGVKKPGQTGPGSSKRKTCRDQAAGVKIFDAPALIGSAVSVAIFFVSSASSFDCAVRVSNCFLV